LFEWAGGRSALRTLVGMTEPQSSVDRAAGSATPLLSGIEWFETLYHELRRRARGELFRHQTLTLGPGTLLHEVWMRLQARPLHFATQPEMVSYAARMMRGIVIDHVRERRALKHGGHLKFESYETLADLRALPDERTLELDAALDALSRTDPRLAELVELKFFAGLSFVEIALLRGVSDRTVQRDWDKARMLLFAALRP
jgi:RNA polymerase sigma factor (TIGR02999 family)